MGNVLKLPGRSGAASFEQTILVDTFLTLMDLKPGEGVQVGAEVFDTESKARSRAATMAKALGEGFTTTLSDITDKDVRDAAKKAWDIKKDDDPVAVEPLDIKTHVVEVGANQFVPAVSVKTRPVTQPTPEPATEPTVESEPVA